jgi:hypothetical protein
MKGVNQTRRTRLTPVILFSLASVACSGGGDSGLDPTAPPTGKHTLTIVSDSGVIATPGETSVIRNDGESVAYSFQVKAGYENLTVFLDSAIVATVGSVKMSREHVLVATAHKIPTVPPEYQPFVDKAKNLLTAANPVQAYAELLTAAAKLGDVVGPAEARRRIDAIAKVAYTDADQAALRRVNVALGGHTFEQTKDGVIADPVVGGLTARPASVRASTRAAEINRPTILITINGVNNDPSGAAGSLDELFRLANELNTELYGGARHFRAILFYNPSAAYVTLKNPDCFEMFTDDVSPLQLWSLSFTCLTLMKGGILVDLSEAAGQMAQIIGVLPVEAREDAKKLTAEITSWLDLKMNVILVPHSQGNLMAIQALSEGRYQQYGPDNRCVGVASFSTPSTVGWKALGPVAGIFQKGTRTSDIILLAPGNGLTQDFTTIQTAITDSLDKVVAAAPAYDFWTEFFADAHLHLVRGYFLGKAREWLKTTVLSEDAAFSGRCAGSLEPPPPPPPPTSRAWSGKEVYTATWNYGLGIQSYEVTYQLYPDTTLAVYGRIRDTGPQPGGIITTPEGVFGEINEPRQSWLGRVGGELLETGQGYYTLNAPPFYFYYVEPNGARGAMYYHPWDKPVEAAPMPGGASATRLAGTVTKSGFHIGETVVVTYDFSRLP